MQHFLVHTAILNPWFPKQLIPAVGILPIRRLRRFFQCILILYGPLSFLVLPRLSSSQRPPVSHMPMDYPKRSADFSRRANAIRLLTRGCERQLLIRERI